MTHQRKIESLKRQLREDSLHVLARHCSNTLRGDQRRQAFATLDMSSLCAILEIGEGFAWVEPKVTMVELVSATLKQGWIPAVVPEFKSITVGGAVMGAALESSSFKYGQFNDICLEYELLLGDGSLIRASPTEHADLFYGISGSYGSLALLTAVKVQLIRAKPYVRVAHVEKFPEGGDGLDFCDGVALGRDEIITMEGTMVERPGKLVRGGFFKEILRRPKESYLSIEHYLFRFDRGAFWMGRYMPFGMYLSSSRLYRYLHRMPERLQGKQFFIHDFYAPQERALEVFHAFSEELELFPIWLCPIKGTMTPQILAPHFGRKSFVNIGIYGKMRRSKSMSSKMEQAILAFGGRKMLYSLTYYGEEQFSQEYEGEMYQKLRKRYHAEGAFPTLYQKVCQRSTPQKSTTSGTT